ncbi:hypothetical protein [Acrocarpospora sp. B8E8]|uniref:hypothetical protein n=1 Tax=Acrocarpospora sp. B8E8 TaxID=3153572 RepID=UPI00325E7E13
MIGETIVILRPGTPTRDSHGNDVPGADTEIDVDHVAVWPTGSTEEIQGQDQTSDSLSALLPYGTDVRFTDRARVRGFIYRVTGVPSSWSSPFTSTRAGVEIRLERVTG